MAIEFACPGCGRTYRVDEAHAGKRTKCMGCETILLVPRPPGAAAPSRPPLQTFGGPAPASKPPLQTFGGPAPAAPAPPPRQPPPSPSADLYGLDDEVVPLNPYRAPAREEPEDEDVPGPRRPGRAGKAKKPRREYAGFWRRVAAVVIDGLFLTFAQLTVAFAFGMFLNASKGRALTKEELEGATPLFVIVWSYFVLMYYVGMVSSAYQGTLGKLAMGIKVYREDGGRLGVGQAFLRELAKAVSALSLGIGLIMAAFTEKKQALHDILVKTLVLKG